jgi:hypothetical protein
MKVVAEKAGLSDIHDLIYSQLSASAAHPKASALEMYAKVNAAGEMIALQWGPNADSVPDSVDHACIAFLHALKIAARVLENVDTDKQAESCLEEYGLLAAPQSPTQTPPQCP